MSAAEARSLRRQLGPSVLKTTRRATAPKAGGRRRHNQAQYTQPVHARVADAVQRLLVGDGGHRVEGGQRAGGVAAVHGVGAGGKGLQAGGPHGQGVGW